MPLPPLHTAIVRAAGLALLCAGTPALADAIQPFGATTLAELQQQFADRPYVVSLWSLDCAPCRQDLQLLGQLKQEDPDFPLLLISTDPIERREEARYVLEDYQLETEVTWMFEDRFAERLRFSIDPAWFGELPRSYFFDASHTRSAHSGVLTMDLLDAGLGLSD